MTGSAYKSMPMAALAGALALAVPAGGALGQTEITIGRTAAPSVFHIPAYIAMRKGLFASEGLAARFVVMTDRAMVTAGLRGAVDFVPNTRGGAQAALTGGQLRFVVGGATISRWAIMVDRRIQKAEDLRGRILARGYAGGPGFGEGERVLREHFGLRIKLQYKGTSFPSEQHRLDALRDGLVQGALLSFPFAAKAEAAGFRVLLRTGAYLPRLDGAYWAGRDNLGKKRAAAAGFIRAIARAIQYLRTDRDGSAEIIRYEFKIKDGKEAGYLCDLVGDAFAADIPDALVHALFETQRQDLIARKAWPKDRKLPDVERFVDRALLTGTLRGMGYRLFPPPDLTRKPN